MIVQLKFKRKIVINAFSYELARTPEEEQEKPTEEEREELENRPGNRAYLYTYIYNMANENQKVHMNCRHFNRIPTLE